MKKKLLLLLYLHFLGVVEVPYIRSITTIVLKGEKKGYSKKRMGDGLFSSSWNLIRRRGEKTSAKEVLPICAVVVW